MRGRVQQLAERARRLGRLEHETAALRAQVGALHARAVRDLPPTGLRDAEFQVFSQFGEDGIIQFLVQRVPVEHEVFVEFGVDDYRESNTRFLLVHDNWRGLIINGDEGHARFAQESELAWRHHLDALTAFIDRDNINALIGGAGVSGDIGVLSIDLDGNDYWVLEAIDVVSPRILVCEYNSVFGPEAAVTVPYDPGFVRAEKHFSWLYWGASLRALQIAAERKGYALVGGNRAGNNVFFVRRDVLGDIPEVGSDEAYAPARFRESRGPAGELTLVSGADERARLFADLPVWDVEAGRTLSVRERFGL